MRAGWRRPGQARPALIEQQHISLAPDPVEYRPAGPTRSAHAGAARATSQIDHRCRRAVPTGCRQAHYAQAHGRTIRFFVPAWHLKERNLGSDGAVLLGLERIGFECQRFLCLARR